jgi:hypothetical protein
MIALDSALDDRPLTRRFHDRIRARATLGRNFGGEPHDRIR